METTPTAKKNKKLLFACAAAVLVLVVVVGWAVILSWGTPSVVSTTMENKVSSNAPLTITFDRLMKPGSVRGAVRIEPSVAGTVGFGLRSFTFTPERALEQKGTVYTLTVSAQATTLLGMPLAKSFTSTFTVVDPPKVIFAAPQGLAQEDSKVSVIFDRPMRSLTTKDAADTLMPLRLEPSAQGTYRWIGTNAVQFTPTKKLNPATTYTIIVPQGVKSTDQGETTHEQRFTFQTPPLEILQTHYPTYPEEKMWISFNHEVDIDSVRKRIHLYYLGKNEPAIPLTVSYGTRTDYEYKDNVQIEKTVENKKVIDILPASGAFGYQEGYWIELDKGVKSIEGSIPSESTLAYHFFTGSYLEYVTPECNGACAHPQPELSFRFHEPVNRASVEKALSFQPSFDVVVEYGKMCNPTWEHNSEKPNEQCPLVDDKNTIRAKAKQLLGNNTPFTVNLKLHELIKEDGTKAFTHEQVFTRTLTTAAPPMVVGHSSPTAKDSYKQFCIFSNNPLNLEQVQNALRFSPEYTKKETNGRRDIYVSSNPPFSTHYGDRGICNTPQFMNAWGTEVRVLLNPLTRYTISLPGTIEDVFGQRIGKDYVIENYTTGELSYYDIYLAQRHKGSIAVVTDSMNIPIVFESKNLAELEFNICRLTPENYIATQTEPERLQRKHYTETGWPAFNPSPATCAFHKKVVRRFAPNYWNSVFHELDIKKELGAQFQNGIYYVNAASPRAYNIQTIDQYSETEQRWVLTPEKKIFMRPSMLLSFTDTHVALKDGNDKLLVWTTGLSDGLPRKDASITFYNAQGAPVLSPRSKTNADGILELTTDNLSFSYAIVRAGTDIAIAQRGWTEGISVWDFNLNWDTLRKDTLGYLYTDRPIYRPGHTVHLKGIFRSEYDARLTVPENKDISLSLSDSNGNTIFTKEIALSNNGTFETNFVLDASAPLGRWYLSATTPCKEKTICANLYASADFSVEEYKAPEYKAELNFNKEEYVNGDTMDASVRGNYFFGAPLANASLTWSLVAQNYYFDGYTKEWFSFSDSDYYYGCYWYCPYEDATITQGETKLDEGGHATLNHTIALEKNAKTSKIYTLHTTLNDGSNRTVSSNKSVVVHRGEFYVGVRTDDYVTKEKSPATFTAIAVDTEGTPLANKKISAELVNIEWKSTKKKNVDGYFYWENEEVEKILEKESSTTGNDGKTTFTFTPPAGGYYRIRVHGVDGKGNTIMSSTGFYATSYEYINWRQENNNRMELKLDKTEYALGDTARLLVLSPYKDVQALVTVERGSILSHRVLAIPSNAHTIDIPITADMLPNAFVSVLLVRKELPGEPPDFKLGYQTLNINTGSKNLFITLSSDKKKYEPGDTVELSLVAENEQREPVAGAEISLAVVDESVLALKGNPTKNLVNFFYGRHGLGVTTISSLVKKLERANITTSPGSKGGGGGGGEPEFNYRGDFKDTAFWKAMLTTDAAGAARATFVLPDNLTSWNVEAVGVTKDSLVGVSTINFTSRKQVMVRSLLPRFARRGDTVTVGAMVHNFTDEPQKFTVSLETKPGETISTQERTVRIEPDESKKITWSVKMPSVSLESRLTTRIKTTDGAHADGVENSIPLLPYGTPESSATMNVTTDSSFTELVQLPKEVDTTQGSLSIRTGATLATFIPDSMEYLFSFPYASNESTVSTILPLMELKKAAQLPAFKDLISFPTIKDTNNKDITLDQLVDITLQRLINSQRFNGGWGYWHDSLDSNPSFTAYTLQGLHAISKAGYTVNETVIKRATEYLRSYMRGNLDIDPLNKKKDTLWADNRAYFLFVLSELGQGDLGLLLNLWDDQKLLSAYGKTMFSLAAHNEIERIGSSNGTTVKLTRIQNDIQKTLEGRARIDTRGTYILQDKATQSHLCTTDTQLTALVLRALTRSNPTHPLVPKMITWLIKTRHNGYWGTTLTTATTLSALTEYLTITKELDAAYTGTVTLNSTPLKPFTINASNVLQSVETTIPLSTLKKDNAVNTVIFSKEGVGKLYYEMVLSYYLPVNNLEARSDGISIERAYYKLSDKEMKSPVVRTTQGETLVGKLTLAVAEERHFVAVDVPLPAGVELVNFDLATSDQSLAHYETGSVPSCWCGGSYWTHKELRDDRLFLFSEQLSPGIYEYTYVVQVTTPGAFTHPPATAIETYFPENGGRTSGEHFFVGD